MGCDIHMVHEVRIYPYGDDRTNRTNGKWINKDTWVANEDYVLYPEDYEHLKDTASAHYEIPYQHRIYRGRNYGLFGILADVRWQCPYGPVALPKGVPSDCSYQTMGEIIRYGGDGHSHSYLTLQELENYNWDFRVKDSDNMKKEEFEKFKEENAEHILEIEPEDDDWPYVSFTWNAPLSHIAGDFYNQTIPKLREYLDEKNGITAEDIRIVFYFDN